MHEALVAKLREHVQLANFFGLEKAESTTLIGEAADAIEELAGFVQEAERDRDEYRERLDKANDAIEQLTEYADTIGRLKCEGWYLQQTKYHDGYQAIATMQLPEPPKEE